MAYLFLESVHIHYLNRSPCQLPFLAVIVRPCYFVHQCHVLHFPPPAFSTSCLFFVPFLSHSAMSVDGVVQCDESGDNTAIVEQSSELNSVIQSQQNSAQVLNSAQLLTVPEPTTQVLSDPVLTNIPPPASKPADRLVPLDLQPFVRYSAVVMSL